MPLDIPFPDAAALYFPFILAWLGLFDRAELVAGETVLIHAAAGGSGSAAIQLAVNAGPRVFATAQTASTSMSRRLGQHVTDSVVELVRAKRVHPVIGQVVPIEDHPAAITAMANRATTGRTIVTL